MPKRRSFLAAGGLATAAMVARAPRAVLAAGPTLLPDLRPFPATAAPFDARGRHDLAADVLTFFVKQKGLFPGRNV